MSHADHQHDFVSVEDRDLPYYCWFFRCRICGAECNDPAELEQESMSATDEQLAKIDATLDELGAPRCADWAGLKGVALSRRGRLRHLVAETRAAIERELRSSIDEQFDRILRGKP